MKILKFQTPICQSNNVRLTILLMQEESSQLSIAKEQTVRLGTMKLIHVLPSFVFFEFNKRFKRRTVRIW